MGLKEFVVQQALNDLPIDAGTLWQQLGAIDSNNVLCAGNRLQFT
jgi:hypothetical protein